MIVIRQKIFETNSSSTNSLSILPKEEYDIWKEDRNIYIDYKEAIEKIYTREEIIEKAKEIFKKEVEEGWRKNTQYNIFPTDPNDIDNLLYEYEFYNKDTYNKYDELEEFSRLYTTKSGDKIVIFGGNS